MGYRACRLTFTAMAAIVASVLSAHAGECTVSKVTAVPIKMMGPWPTVVFSINDVPGRFIVDTGAADTILSSDYGSRSHVGRDTREGIVSQFASGNMYGGMLSVESDMFRDSGRALMTSPGGTQTMAVRTHARHIQFGDIGFQDWEFWMEPTKDAQIGNLDGVLGRDFLHYFDIEIDFKANRLTLWRVKDCKEIHPVWSGDYDNVPLTKGDHGQIGLPVMIDDILLDMQLDTAARSMLLSHIGAIKSGARDADLTRDQNAPGLGAPPRTVQHKFLSFEIGTQEYRNALIDVSLAGNVSVAQAKSSTGVGQDGVINLDKFNADRVWISPGTASLFVQTAQQAQLK